MPHSCVSQREEQEGLRRAEILPGDALDDPELAPGAPNPIHMHFLDLRKLANFSPHGSLTAQPPELLSPLPSQAEFVLLG